MSAQARRAHRTIIVTVSTSRADADAPAEDRTGAKLQRRIERQGGEVVGRTLVPDDLDAIIGEARRASALADVVVFAGGTGVAPSDVTPDALSVACDRLLPGFGELMRTRGALNPKVGIRAYLSRSQAGVLGRALILAVPGSPGGACDSYAAVAPLLDHVVQLLAGDVTSCQDELPRTD